MSGIAIALGHLSAASNGSLFSCEGRVLYNVDGEERGRDSIATSQH